MNEPTMIGKGVSVRSLTEDAYLVTIKPGVDLSTVPAIRLLARGQDIVTLARERRELREFVVDLQLGRIDPVNEYGAYRRDVAAVLACVPPLTE